MSNQVRLRVQQTGRATSEATIRSHKVLVDRPAEKGGDDNGPMGGELLLAGLGGCFMSNLLAAILAREADVSNVRTDVAATVDGNPARFTAVELNVSADCDDPELLEKLVTIAERGCIAANTMKGAVELTVRTARAAAAG